MMTASQSGVIACHSISTTRLEDTSQNSSPFKAWPEIKEWNRYYLLPTIGGIYLPEAPPHFPEVPPPNYMEALEALLVQWFPQLEPHRSRLIAMVEEYYLSHFGSEFNRQNLLVTCVNVVRFLIGHEPVDDVWAVEMTKALSLEDTFSTNHELGHLASFQLIRPAITQYKVTWSEIEDLLLQATTWVHDGFWRSFNDLNSKLKTCLSNSLALEELRANIFALLVAPRLQETFINLVYAEERENGRSKEKETFHNLQSLTGGRLILAWFLTILAECLNSANPVRALEELQQLLQAENADTWSNEHWSSWFDSWKRLEVWETVARTLDEVYEKKIVIMTNAMLIGRPNGTVEISCSETMRLPLFHESMRQQLDHRKRLRNLTCPFKGRRRSCCGFGHYLRNIWATIPTEEQRRLKPPSQVCLNCTPIYPL
jgi:hypothetical protein